MENMKELVSGSTKAAMKAVSAKSRDLWQVFPEQLRAIPGFNVRVRDDAYIRHIRNIADSIKAEGFDQTKPLAGYVAVEDGEQVIYYYDGHTRHEAVMLAISEGAEIERVPVVVAQPGTSMVDLTVALVKANNGKPLTAYETGVVCKRLSRFGWDSSDIAKRLNFSVQYVDNLLLLVSAPESIQRMVQSGELSAAQAVETLRSEGDRAVEVLEAAKVKANSEGKKRVTAKHMPGAAFRKVVKKQAETMASTIESVVDDPAFDALSDENKAKIKAIINALEEARKKAEEVDEQPEGAD
jgi:ParB family chromosome partitioning protein